MEKETRTRIQNATQAVRRLLEEEYTNQLEGTFDVLRSGKIGESAAHLDERQQLVRERIVAAIRHKEAGGMKAHEAVADYVRDASFTTLNRFAALKMLEARELVRECVSRGDQSRGYKEFWGFAEALTLLPEQQGYRLYLESIFDELSSEIKVLFDRRDAAALLWPRRQALAELLGELNDSELASVWGDDETIGWVYQYFNADADREKARYDENGKPKAPQNSRELAVRNQFFTPRYVVQFLVDNTLGRTWKEMRRGETRLVETCQYMVRREHERYLDPGVEPKEDEDVRFRAKKDPRDLRILDPACGSGHFLLYSFDLLVTIYEEAWSDVSSPASEVTGSTLRENYETIDELRSAMPGLILAHNLFGVEIDPRCAQIAALALWMRAQRAFADYGIARSDREPIRRTNIVIAEPMPGEKDLLDEFASTVQPPLLGHLIRTIAEKMQLAGEIGVLLKIESEIASALTAARKDWDAGPQFRKQTSLFQRGSAGQQEFAVDISGISDAAFWVHAEGLLVDALHRFVAEGANGRGFRRKLFADDAEAALAMIDVCRARFDVVLMNPPFGAVSIGPKMEFEKTYPRTKNDIYAAFVERGILLLHSHGFLGAITSRTGFFLSSFQKWREEILLKDAPPVVFADLGSGVMDSAMVEAAAYCLEKGRASSLASVFLRVFDANKKAEALCEGTGGFDTKRLLFAPRRFQSIPTSPFAYWITPSIERTFERCPVFISEGREARQGASSTSAFRYLRLWTEPRVEGVARRFVDAQRGRALWVPFAKGGAYSRYHSDLHLLMKWADDGREVKEDIASWRARKGWGYTWSATLNGYVHYGRPGLTWTSRTQGGFSMRVLNSGCIFADKGPAAFVSGDGFEELLVLLALTNSRVFSALVALQMAFGSYEVGVIQRTPVPQNLSQGAALASMSRKAWNLKQSLDSCVESSHAFLLPPLLQVCGGDMDSRAAARVEYVQGVQDELAHIQATVDDRCFDLYGLDKTDRLAVGAGIGGELEGVLSTTETDEPESDEFTDAEGEGSFAKPAALASEAVSWMVGVCFGRFDVRLATGARPLPAEPEPFDPLPSSSPGMLTGTNGLPLDNLPVDYPVGLTESRVLVDDPGIDRDIRSALRAVFDVVFGADANCWWEEIASLLDPKSRDLRVWLSNSYFEQHIKRYSKSRRKAPIYWQLATPSASYSVWLYAHRLKRDSFFQIQKDIVELKLLHEENEFARFVREAGPTPTSERRKNVAAQEAFVAELRAFRDEIARVAPLWNPNLDDGVVITSAPLWRLFPHHKAWQKELKGYWDELCAGKYNWSHLAMHLWPERVVPNCATDRSIAIAHDLEEIFWVEDAKGKWKERTKPTRPIEELVAERTSPAVKAALQALIEAPVAGGAGTKRRSRRT